MSDFVDSAQIHVRSGDGGSGAVSFRRESHVPRGGPDGGNGGRGGHVFFRASSRLKSLLDFRYKKKYKASNGEQGMGQNRSGRNGEDLFILVPVGTMLYSKGSLVYDFLEEGETYLLAEGGLGGKGNTFYKSSVHQAPEISQKGLPGTEFDINLELKLLADAGLVGFPNVGKSSLISVLSAAKPEIANYPFTTLNPNLGVVSLGPLSHFVIADIPGLVEGASQGVGLGHKFLKHVERCQILVHVVDLDPHNSRQVWQDYRLIREELKAYEKKLSDPHLLPLSQREEICVLNKLDLISPMEREKVLGEFHANGVEALLISCATGKGIKELKQRLAQLILDKSS